MDLATQLGLYRDIAQALKRQRLNAGLSTAELAAKVKKGDENLRFSQPKAWRLENGQVRPGADDIRAWGKATGTHPAEIERLAELAVDLAVEGRTWRTAFSGPAGMAGAQHDVAKVEAASTRIRAFAGTILPGLLQTPSYSHEVLSRLDGAKPDQIPDAVQKRVDRQAVLQRPEKRFEFVVGQLALRWLPRSGDPQLWSDQAQRLLELSEFVDLFVRPERPPWPVLPNTAVILFDGPDGRNVLVENERGEHWLDHEYDHWAAVYDDLRGESVSGAQAEELILQSIA